MFACECVIILGDAAHACLRVRACVCTCVCVRARVRVRVRVRGLTNELCNVGHESCHMYQ